MGIEESRAPFEDIRFPDEDMENEFAKDRGEAVILFDERISYQDELTCLVQSRDFEGAFLLVKERERRDELWSSSRRWRRSLHKPQNSLKI